MKREILVSTLGGETRVAILEDGELVELLVERPDAGRMVGDIYKGRVQSVLPGIQAAFVDLGLERAGFLHVSDLVRDGGRAEEEEEEGDEEGGNGGPRYPPIESLVRKGDELLVQVTKEPIGTKGPRLTTHVTLPGRFLVYLPFSQHIGVSRKIEDPEERARLRALAQEILPPGSGGLIVRTVGEELSRETFERELRGLLATWRDIQRRAQRAKAPALVHQEARLVKGVLRDIFSQKVDRLVVDDPEVFTEVRAYLQAVEPTLLDRVVRYDDPAPLFDAYQLEPQIRQVFQRKVMLPSGGHLVIEPTEALVSIDVNTGRGTGRRDPQSTILRTNLDAAREIARQLRLRDVGGIVVCDFIDMESRVDRDRVLQELRTHLARDRARTKTLQVSELGLVEMTRQRVRPSLYMRMTQPCPHCGGTGRIFTPETVARQLERALWRVRAAGEEREVEVRVHPEVVLYLLEQEPDFLARMERTTGLSIDLRDDPLLKQDAVRLRSRTTHQDLTARYWLG